MATDEEDRRSLFELVPLKKALEYVVQESRKHAAAGHDDQFVAVGRVCHAALKWQQADENGDFDLAEEWLAKLPLQN
jgi:hypothetical protein